VRLRVHLNDDPQLPQIAGTLNRLRLQPRPAKRWQQEGNQDRDNPNDNKKFKE
jgi:hypothetical protein